MKRTAWNSTLPARRAPIARSFSPLTSVPMPPRTAPMARRRTGKGSATGQSRPPGEFTPRVKLAIRTRAGNGDPAQARCEIHGDFLGAHAGEYHHRQGRGMGGSRDAVVNSAANGVLACPAGHRACEARDEHLGAQGFWLRRWQDPRTEPVMLHGEEGGITVWLGVDGGYLSQPPEGVAA